MHTWCNHFHILPATLLLHSSLPILLIHPSYFVTVCQGEGEREAAVDTALLRLWCDAFPSSLNSGVLSPKWSCANEKLLLRLFLCSKWSRFWFISFCSFFHSDWRGAFSMWTRFFRTPRVGAFITRRCRGCCAHGGVRCDRGFFGFILNGPFQQIGICDRGQNIMVPCVVTHNDRSLQDSPQDCQRILTVLLSLQWLRAYREEFRIFPHFRRNSDMYSRRLYHVTAPWKPQTWWLEVFGMAISELDGWGQGSLHSFFCKQKPSAETWRMLPCSTNISTI